MASGFGGGGGGGVGVGFMGLLRENAYVKDWGDFFATALKVADSPEASEYS